MANPKSSTSSSGALRRGLQVLALLHEYHPAYLSIREISEQTGLPRPTVYRLLEALTSEGCTRRHLSKGSFQFVRIGPEFTKKSPSNKRLAAVISKMKQIAQATGDSVYLVVPNGTDSMCIHREFGHYPIQVNSLAIGQNQPLGIGSGGLSILAASTDEQVEEVFELNQSRFGQYNGLSTPILRQLVKNTRSRGYAIIGNYAIPGITGVGMAVIEKGQPIAGLCVSSTTERMSVSHQRLIADCLQAALIGLR